MSKVKNPFKKKSLTDTLVNTAIGGAGNVVFDTIWGYLPDSLTKDTSDIIKNVIKLVGGAVAGGMVSNRYLRAMTDGFAVVGASDLVSGLINQQPTAGLPDGTIGRMPRYGSPKYRSGKKSRIAGLQDFMGE